jgi:hypothetical protein
LGGLGIKAVGVISSISSLGREVVVEKSHILRGVSWQKSENSLEQ